MKKVLAIGNALLDSLVTLNDDALLTQFDLDRGTMSLVDKSHIDVVLNATEGLERSFSMGGTAGNCVRSVALVGGVAGYIGMVGDDEAGRSFSSKLVDMGIESRILVNKTEATGQCVSLISPDGERTMTTFLGAALELSAEDITPELLSGYEILFIEGYLVQNPCLIRRIFEVARSLDMMITIDMSSYNVVEESLDLLKELTADGVSIIFANEQEAQVVTGSDDPFKAADMIAELCDVAVVKVGVKGSIIVSGDEVVEVGATNHVRRDSTGAGDFYAGGFLTGFSRGDSLVKSAQIGAIAAGAIIEVVGTTLTDEQWESAMASIRRL